MNEEKKIDKWLQECHFRGLRRVYTKEEFTYTKNIIYQRIQKQRKTDKVESIEKKTGHSVYSHSI